MQWGAPEESLSRRDIRFAKRSAIAFWPLFFHFTPPAWMGGCRSRHGIVSSNTLDSRSSVASSPNRSTNRIPILCAYPRLAQRKRDRRLTRHIE